MLNTRAQPEMFECATATFCSTFVASMPVNFSSLASRFCSLHYSLAVNHDEVSNKYQCSGAVQMLALFEKEGATKLRRWLRRHETEQRAACASPNDDRCRTEVAFSSEITDAVVVGKSNICHSTGSSTLFSRQIALSSSSRHAASERCRPFRTGERRASGADGSSTSVFQDCSSCSRSGSCPSDDCTSTPGTFSTGIVATVSTENAFAPLSRTANCSGRRIRDVVAAKPFALLRCRRCPFVTLHLGFLLRHEAVAHRRDLLRASLPPTDRRCARGDGCCTRRCASSSCRGAAADSSDHHLTTLVTPIVGNRLQTCQAVACPSEAVRPRSSKVVASPRLRGDRHPGTVVAERRRRCPNCDYVTSSSSHLSRHVRVTHGNLRPFLCDACGSAFKTNDALRQHRSYVHGPGRLPFACSTCAKTFRSRYHLAQHAGRHTTERSFLCHVCGAAFKTLSCANRHVRHLHTNPGGFSCPICSKRFNSSFSLKRHGSTHSI